MSSSIYFPRLRKLFLQSPPVEWILNQVRQLLINALRQGPIPQHVAFVMDGNRRYAKARQIESIDGHNRGFEALARILEVCYKTGVKVVSIYAFSTENFNRPKYEVEGLMQLAKIKLEQFSQHGELLDRYGACIRILGEMDLVTPDLRKAADDAVELTKHNDRAILNVCFPYTSRDEITSAIRSTVAEYSQPLAKQDRQLRSFSEQHIAQNIRSRRLGTLREESASRSSTPDSTVAQASGSSLVPPLSEDQDPSTSESLSESSSSSKLQNDSSSPNTSYAQSPERSNIAYPDPETITEETLDAHMYTAGCPPLDMLIRTSGVERLSNFMLWQCHQHTSIFFSKALWPEFDLWHFLPIMLEWQWWRLKK